MFQDLNKWFKKHQFGKGWVGILALSLPHCVIVVPSPCLKFLPGTGLL